MHILFIGNGFDLYHELKTSYDDFLKVIKNLTVFYDDITFYLEKNGDNTEERFFKDYFVGNQSIDLSKVRKICDLLLNNVWAIYYASCNANIQGWIDFEKEMNPVFDFFRAIFDRGIGINGNNGYIPKAAIKTLSYKEYALATIFREFFYILPDGSFQINADYFNDNYGLLKDKIIRKLEDDLDDFIWAFSLYLNQFVETKKIETYGWIREFKPDRIISFNYTHTEDSYFKKLTAESFSHIHGTTDCGNIVFGTDLIEDNDTDFMYFSKRFQRLSKVGDYSYLKFINEKKEFDELFNNKREALEVSFIGCSLDKNDASIFKKYVEKATTVEIFCYGFDDYKNKISNMISIFNSETIVDYDKKKKLHFFDMKELNGKKRPKEINPQTYYKRMMQQILPVD